MIAISRGSNIDIATTKRALTEDGQHVYATEDRSLVLNAIPMEFTYAYAITAHKSQGSEWDKVLVIEEKFPFNKVEHARWLYTACTRASSRLVLVR